jgi:hypothetical protein
LGFNTLGNGAATPKGGLSPSSELIFPNVSSQTNTVGTKYADPTRTASQPLMPGDFVDLPTRSAGSVLDFFLISNGAHGGKTVFTGTASRNIDHASHIVAYAIPDSPYLLLGFEDKGRGGDYDYNDVLFALDLGKATIQKLVAAPEPSTWFVLAGFLAVIGFACRRSRTSVVRPGQA